MEKLSLVEEGIFPICFDKLGNRISDLPNTGWDFPGTIQGEGKLAGVPSLFVRLASCNLRCVWQLPDGELSKCDTSYASFNVQGVKEWLVDDIVAVISKNLGSVQHVVISGGEPLLQAKSLAVLCKSIKEKLGVHITIESNGTIFSEDVANYVDLISLSPKLSNSNPDLTKLTSLGLAATAPFLYHAKQRLNIDALQQWIDYMDANNGDYQLKFVVANVNEGQEIKQDFLKKLRHVKASNVLVMPLGGNMTQLSQTAHDVLKLAVVNGWRYCSRLHIEMFGSRMGV